MDRNRLLHAIALVLTLLPLPLHLLLTGVSFDVPPEAWLAYCVAPLLVVASWLASPWAVRIGLAAALLLYPWILSLLWPFSVSIVSLGLLTVAGVLLLVANWPRPASAIG